MSDRDLYQEFSDAALMHFNTIMQGAIGLPMYLPHRMLDQDFKDIFCEEARNAQPSRQWRAPREACKTELASHGIFELKWKNLDHMGHDREDSHEESQINEYGESVVSTSTQSTSRTFPDGSTVTKTIRSRRFADGSNERVENEHKTPPKFPAPTEIDNGPGCSQQRITDLAGWPRDEFMKTKQPAQRTYRKIDVQEGDGTRPNQIEKSDTQQVDRSLKSGERDLNHTSSHGEGNEGKAKRKGWFWS